MSNVFYNFFVFFKIFLFFGFNCHFEHYFPAQPTRNLFLIIVISSITSSLLLSRNLILIIVISRITSLPSPREISSSFIWLGFLKGIFYEAGFEMTGWMIGISPKPVAGARVEMTSSIVISSITSLQPLTRNRTILVIFYLLDIIFPCHPNIFLILLELLRFRLHFDIVQQLLEELCLLQVLTHSKYGKI